MVILKNLALTETKSHNYPAMNKHLTWVIPTAVICSASTLFAVQYLTIEQAKIACFPKATRWEEQRIELTKAQAKNIQTLSGIKTKVGTQVVYTAYDASTLLGWMIPDSVIGKHDWIDWVLAINPNGSVKQVEIMVYREAYGGDIKKEVWREQFKGKKVSDSVAVGKDIKHITGATLSSKHITEGVKRLLVFHNSVIKN